MKNPDLIWRNNPVTARGLRSIYVYALLEGPLGGFVAVVDLDGPKSVTNDAERVCTEIYIRHHASTGSGMRIIYRDTQGDWSELKHTKGTFTDFVLPVGDKDFYAAVDAAKGVGR